MVRDLDHFFSWAQRGVFRPVSTIVPWYARSLIGDVPPGVALSPRLELVDVVRTKFPPAFHFCLELRVGRLVVVALDGFRESTRSVAVAGQQRSDSLTRKTSVHEEVLVDDLAELRARLPFVVLVEDGEQTGEATSNSQVGLGVEVLDSLPSRALQSSPERKSDKDLFVVRGGRVDALDAESVVRVRIARRRLRSPNQRLSGVLLHLPVPRDRPFCTTRRRVVMLCV